MLALAQQKKFQEDKFSKFELTTHVIANISYRTTTLL